VAKPLLPTEDDMFLSTEVFRRGEAVGIGRERVRVVSYDWVKAEMRVWAKDAGWATVRKGEGVFCFPPSFSSTLLLACRRLAACVCVGCGIDNELEEERKRVKQGGGWDGEFVQFE
jgi:hypothetical protein